MSPARVMPVGTSAVLIEPAADDGPAALAVVAALRAALADRVSREEAAGRPAGVVETVPAARTLLVRLAPGPAGRQALDELRRQVAAPSPTSAPATGTATGTGDVVELPVAYDGPDLDDVARLTGLPAREVVRRHTATPWTVAFTGFAPGFGYLTGGDPALVVPRRSTPRTEVPAGSVGLAGEFSGVYPRRSPGGWQLLGRTDAVLWDLARDPPALMAPGVRVRFSAVSALPPPATPDAPVTAGTAGTTGTTDATGAALEVLDPGPGALVEDLGRPGVTHLGLSASGALDRGALRRANRAVGNRPGAPAVEAVGALVVRARRSVVVALAGAATDPVVQRAGTGRRERTVAGLPVALDDGDTLAVAAPAVSGAAAGPVAAVTVLAVRGGLGVAAVLGSASRDVLAGLGPAPLRAGTVLPVAVGNAGEPSPWLAGSVAVTADPASHADGAGAGPVVLDVVLGPRQDWFDAASVVLITEQHWEVTPRSNRVGARLQGARGLLRGRAGGSPASPRELASEPVVRGALQVPPDGQPVLFGPDHPVTGGYPVVACVVEHHLDAAGRLPVGARVRFRPVGPGSP